MIIIIIIIMLSAGCSCKTSVLALACSWLDAEAQACYLQVRRSIKDRIPKGGLGGPETLQPTENMRDHVVCWLQLQNVRFGTRLLMFGCRSAGMLPASPKVHQGPHSAMSMRGQWRHPRAKPCFCSGAGSGTEQQQLESSLSRASSEPEVVTKQLLPGGRRTRYSDAEAASATGCGSQGRQPERLQRRRRLGASLE